MRRVIKNSRQFKDFSMILHHVGADRDPPLLYWYKPEIGNDLLCFSRKNPIEILFHNTRRLAVCVHIKIASDRVSLIVHSCNGWQYICTTSLLCDSDHLQIFWHIAHYVIAN